MMTVGYCRKREDRSVERARVCARLTAGLLALYSALFLLMALFSGYSFFTGQSSGIPFAAARFGSALLSGLTLGWVLSSLARGMYALQFWAWGLSLLATTGLALFYLQNTLQFRWFTPWLLQLPLMLVLLALSFPAVKLRRLNVRPRLGRCRSL